MHPILTEASPDRPRLQIANETSREAHGVGRGAEAEGDAQAARDVAEIGQCREPVIEEST